jgi:hypothetical protein
MAFKLAAPVPKSKWKRAVKCPKNDAAPVFANKKPGASAPGLLVQTGIRLRQNVARSHRGAERAGRLRANTAIGISAASRAGRKTAGRVQLDVRRQVVREGDGLAGGFLLFECELVGRRVNLAEVVDAGVGLRSGSGFYEVWNRNRRQEADDGHDDHDFHQRKAGLADVFNCLHFYFLSSIMRREQRERRVMMITALSTSLPVATALPSV